MKKTALILSVVFLLSLSFAAAHGEEGFAQAEEIVMQQVPCSELTQGQLEILGDYYMEQMHPGELHEIMDERMGGEDSESLRQVHINMGSTFYCGEHDEFSGGMMDTMMGRTGMMGGFYPAYGMMSGSYGTGAGSFWVLNWVLMVLIIVALVLLIVWLVRRLQGKQGRKRR